MTNEEVLRTLLEEFRRTIESQTKVIEGLQRTVEQLQKTVEELRNNNNSIDQEEEIAVEELPPVNDSLIYGTDKDNYYRNLDRQIADEYLKRQKELEEAKKYVPGTDILKPHEQRVFETDRDYINYLRDYCIEYFDGRVPEGAFSDALVEKVESAIKEQQEYLKSGINLSEEDAFRRLIDENNKVINEYEEDLNTSNQEKNEAEQYENINPENSQESRDIFSNSDGSSASMYANEGGNIGTEEFRKAAKIASQEGAATAESNSSNEGSGAANEEQEKKKESQGLNDNSEVIEFASEEERQAFEASQGVNYKTTGKSETKKIGKIRKALGKFKDSLKKYKKKIIAGVLVATAALGVGLTIKACSYDNKDDLAENKDNPKSNTANYNDTVPSVSVADSFEAKINEALANAKYGSNSDKNVDEVNADEIKETINQKKNENYDISDSTYDVGLQVGDPVKLTGDYLYTNSYDAENNIDPLTPYYSNDDNRAISLVQYKGPNGENATAYTKEDQKIFEEQGWTPVAYNMENLDRDGLTYEGWVNPDDVMEVTVKSK